MDCWIRFASRIEKIPISAVIQGPLSDVLHASIHNLRAFDQISEIAWATFVSDIEIESCGCIDQLVICDDPGTIDFGATSNNINRLIISSREGLLAASHDLVLKIRSDTVFTTNAFFARPVQKGIIRVPSHGFFHPLRTGVLFHVPDGNHFGWKADLLTYWSSSLFRSEDSPFDSRNRKSRHHFFLQFRFTSEQLLAIRYLESIERDVQSPAYAGDTDLARARAGLKLVLKRFEAISPKAAGLAFPARLKGSFLSRWRHLRSYQRKTSVGSIFVVDFAYWTFFEYLKGLCLT